MFPFINVFKFDLKESSFFHSQLSECICLYFYVFQFDIVISYNFMGFSLFNYSVAKVI